MNIPEDFAFSIRIYASNSIAFIKDKTKEEHEKKLKEKWEEDDEGRGALAVKSRKKFLLYAKDKKKEKLDENELKLLHEDRKRRTANEIDHIQEEEVTDPKNPKGKKIAAPKPKENKPPGEKPKDKVKGPSTSNAKKDTNTEEEETTNVNVLTRNIMGFLNHQVHPLSMEKINKKEKVLVHSQSQYIINFIDYSMGERTLYRQKFTAKMPLIKDKYNLRNKRIILSDQEYKEKLKGSILSKYEDSKNALKKENEIYLKSSLGLIDGINTYNKNLNSQRKAQTISKNNLLNRRQSLKTLIQQRIDTRRELSGIIAENRKILENIKINKKDLANKKGDLVNYEELLRIYNSSAAILGPKDLDIIAFFNIISDIKYQEIKYEYERIIETGDKNKESIITKILEDIQNNKYNINSDFLEKLKSEVRKEPPK